MAAFFGSTWAANSSGGTFPNEPGGRLIFRATASGTELGSWRVRFEHWKWKAAGRKPYLRTAEELRTAALEAGYTVERLEPCTPGPRVIWILATR
jgi:hypothetical protein